MKQNRLKELILSIGKSRHNMFKKVETFALAILDKGSVDMDTHELSNLVKDTFTKRRAKEFYADVFSSVIGKSNGAGTAPTFACNKLSMSGGGDPVITASTWTLGSEAINLYDEQHVTMYPYIVFLTEEQKSKIQIKADVNLNDTSTAEDIVETLQIAKIEDTGMSSDFLVGIPSDCKYAFLAHVLGDLDSFKEEPNWSADDYIKITITYDGVDYVYLV